MSKDETLLPVTQADRDAFREWVGLRDEMSKSMADRIADKMYLRTHPGWIGGQHCALAAIMETQEAIASFVETHAYLSSGPESGMEPSRLARDDRHHATIARFIRAGEHYALAGDRYG